MKETIRFRLNGQAVDLESEPDRLLLWTLRTHFGLTGTKFGCGQGICGACTVLVDGEPVRSCVTPVRSVRDRDVLTIEGLAPDGRLHPIQQAFVDGDVAQCGYCTPGMILSAHALLLRNPRPTRADVIAALDDNLCRCGTHVRIVNAVLAAAEAMAGGRP